MVSNKASTHASDNGTQQKLPLIVAVTGHRDLREQDMPAIRKQVEEVLLGLQQGLTHTPLCVLSALADGADRLVAEVALDLRDAGHLPGAQILCPLPLPEALYKQDFSAESCRQFDALCERVGRQNVFELEPYLPGTSQHPEIDEATLNALSLPEKSARTAHSNGGYSDLRNLQYAQLGAYLARHAHLVLALWDGLTPGKPGGTGEVVRVMRNGDMHWGQSIPPRLGLDSRSLVGGGELGAVLHLPVKRKSTASGAVPQHDEDQQAPDKPRPAWQRWLPQFRPTRKWFSLGSIRWYYTEHKKNSGNAQSDPTRQGEESGLIQAQRHELAQLLDGLESFNRDVTKFQDKIQKHTLYPSDGDSQTLETHAAKPLRIHLAADAIALNLQSRLSFWLKLQYSAVLAIGFGFAMFGNWPEAFPVFGLGSQHMDPFWLCLLLLGGGTFLGVSAGLHGSHIQQRFHDSRALAEATRVAVYASYAGFLRELGDRSPEARSRLAWLEGAWQWLSLDTWTTTSGDSPAACTQVRDWWLNTQQAYFKKKSETERSPELRMATRMALTVKVLLASGMLLLLATALANAQSMADLAALSNLIMGLLLLLAAVFKQWLDLKAYAEDQERYTLAETVFRRGQLEFEKSIHNAAPDVARARKVFTDVAKYALDENYRWYRTHYERSLSVEA